MLPEGTNEARHAVPCDRLCNERLVPIRLEAKISQALLLRKDSGTQKFESAWGMNSSIGDD